MTYFKHFEGMTTTTTAIHVCAIIKIYFNTYSQEGNESDDKGTLKV